MHGHMIISTKMLVYVQLDVFVDVSVFVCVGVLCVYVRVRLSYVCCCLLELAFIRIYV